jgi:CRP/FNR family cyclic AMP-dependent transcriptional regulator
MRGPYGFEMSENCQTCKLKKSSFFCDLMPKAMKDFDSIKLTSAFPERAVLFMEKQDSRGVFVLCQGEVKLTISSSEGKTLILRIAKAGEILGLMSVLAGKPYEVSAETLRPSQIAFIRRDDFLRFVAQHPEVSAGVVKQLSGNYHTACEQLRTVGLSTSVQGRLAKLLLDWSDEAEQTKLGIGVCIPLTHQEIAECIGSSRETVTRAFAGFKNQHLVAVHGSSVLITNRKALQSLVAA